MTSKESDIIQNPNRRSPQPQVPYEPEYVRLNRDPVLMPDASGVRSNVVQIVPNKPAPAPLPVVLATDFSSVDGITVDENGKEIVPPIDYIIDNNEFVDYRSYNPPLTTHQKTQAEPTALSTPEVNEYILMVKDKIVQTGDLQNIENKVSAIVYGEDKEFSNTLITDIIVLKRIPIKVGVFIG